MPDEVNLAAPAIELRSISKVYENVRTKARSNALDAISFQIRDGEFVSLLGPSGSGKTTLLNIIAGLERPTTGEVLHDGKRVEGPSADRGMLFQEYALFPWRTVWQNVEFGLRYGSKGSGVSRNDRADIVRRLIERVGLIGAEGKFPHELSGGMKQRCALARLLAYDPDVLLMDEPLAAVDAQTRYVLQEELLRVWGETSAQRKTVVYVTHSIDEAIYLSDRVIILHRHPGRIKEEMSIDLERPRQKDVRTSPRFQRLVELAWDQVRDEAYRATLESLDTAEGATE